MLLARRSLAALGARRATSARPVGRAVLPQAAQRLQQNLIGGAVNASATTSATGLSLNHLIVESNAADSLQAPVNDLVLTPRVELPVSAAMSAAQLDRRVRFAGGARAGPKLVAIIKAHLANRA